MRSDSILFSQAYVDKLQKSKQLIRKPIAHKKFDADDLYPNGKLYSDEQIAYLTRAIDKGEIAPDKAIQVKSKESTAMYYSRDVLNKNNNYNFKFPAIVNRHPDGTLDLIAVYYGKGGKKADYEIGGKKHGKKRNKHMGAGAFGTFKLGQNVFTGETTGLKVTMDENATEKNEGKRKKKKKQQEVKLPNQIAENQTNVNNITITITSPLIDEITVASQQNLKESSPVEHDEILQTLEPSPREDKADPEMEESSLHFNIPPSKPSKIDPSPRLVVESPRSGLASPRSVKESPRSGLASPRSVKESPRSVKASPRSTKPAKLPAKTNAPTDWLSLVMESADKKVIKGELPILEELYKNSDKKNDLGYLEKISRKDNIKRQVFLMPYINGMTLKSYLKSNAKKKISMKTGLKLSCSVIHEVVYNFHQGLLHRDLKPDNFIINKFLGAKEIDVGGSVIIKTNHPSYPEDEVIGTLAWSGHVVAINGFKADPMNNAADLNPKIVAKLILEDKYKTIGLEELNQFTPNFTLFYANALLDRLIKHLIKNKLTKEDLAKNLDCLRKTILQPIMQLDFKVAEFLADAIVKVINASHLQDNQKDYLKQELSQADYRAFKKPLNNEKNNIKPGKLIFSEKGCQIVLISREDLNSIEEVEHAINKEDLDYAQFNKTPILIRTKDKCFIYGDSKNPNAEGEWAFKEIKDCDLLLISIDELHKIREKDLENARTNKTPILIKTKDNKWFVYGDPSSYGKWKFTEITEVEIKVFDEKTRKWDFKKVPLETQLEQLSQLPFKNGILKRKDPKFNLKLIEILSTAHADLDSDVINDLNNLPFDKGILERDNEAVFNDNLIDLLHDGHAALTHKKLKLIKYDEATETDALVLMLEAIRDIILPVDDKESQDYQRITKFLDRCLNLSDDRKPTLEEISEFYTDLIADYTKQDLNSKENQIAYVNCKLLIKKSKQREAIDFDLLKEYGEVILITDQSVTNDEKKTALVILEANGVTHVHDDHTLEVPQVRANAQLRPRPLPRRPEKVTVPPLNLDDNKSSLKVGQADDLIIQPVNTSIDSKEKEQPLSHPVMIRQYSENSFGKKHPRNLNDRRKVLTHRRSDSDIERPALTSENQQSLDDTIKTQKSAEENYMMMAVKGEDAPDWAQIYAQNIKQNPLKKLKHQLTNSSKFEQRFFKPEKASLKLRKNENPEIKTNIVASPVVTQEIKREKKLRRQKNIISEQVEGILNSSDINIPLNEPFNWNININNEMTQNDSHEKEHLGRRTRGIVRELRKSITRKHTFRQKKTDPALDNGNNENQKRKSQEQGDVVQDVMVSKNNPFSLLPYAYENQGNESKRSSLFKREISRKKGVHYNDNKDNQEKTEHDTIKSSSVQVNLKKETELQQVVEFPITTVKRKFLRDSQIESPAQGKTNVDRLFTPPPLKTPPITPKDSPAASHGSTITLNKNSGEG